MTADPYVKEAIKEAAAHHMAGLVPKVTHALEAIVDDPLHRDHYKALDGILARVGMPQVTEHKTTVEHTLNKAELVASIRGMMETLGYLVVSKILPPAGLRKIAPTVTQGDTVIEQKEDE